MTVISTPTRADITAGCTADLIGLIRQYSSSQVRFIAPLGIYIQNLRQYSASLAQQVGASHILFIDSDMRFPKDSLDRLRAWDVDVVGANSKQRTKPHWWNARVNGVPLSSVGRTGLQVVESVGFGLMLIRLSVLDRLPRPWFDTPYDGENHIGEDKFFCQQATKAGIKVFVDHDLSQEVEHKGDVELGVNTEETVIA